MKMPTEVMRAPGVANSTSGPSRGPQFAFAIPFKPKSACADWEQAQANLQRTICSVRGAGAAITEPAIVAVACHDEPELDVVSGEEVHLLSVPFAEPVDRWGGARDKSSKRRFIGAWLREALIGEQTYVMFLVADDLVHENIIEYALANG